MTCYFCGSQVQNYKSNSHVIPKSFIKPAKMKAGYLAYLGVLDGITKKVQDGVKGDFICSNCEDEFTKDDTYGSLVLMGASPQSAVYKDLVFERFQHIKMSFLRISNFNFQKLKKFVLSILLRDYCMRKVNGAPALMDEVTYKSMKSHYDELSSISENRIFKIVIHRLEDVSSGFSYTVAMPVLSQLGDSLTFTCGGYAFMVYLGQPSDRQMSAFVDSFGLQEPGTICMPVTDFTLLGTFKHAKEVILNKMQEWDRRYPEKK